MIVKVLTALSLVMFLVKMSDSASLNIRTVENPDINMSTEQEDSLPVKFK
jgi:hypothetical protein